jgi:hypothetical protein
MRNALDKKIKGLEVPVARMLLQSDSDFSIQKKNSPDADCWTMRLELLKLKHATSE